MIATPLEGRAAELATLQAKMSVARLRSQYAATAGQRADELAKLRVYEASFALLRASS